MKPPTNNSRPRNTFLAKSFALLVSCAILGLLMSVNMQLYGNTCAFAGQLFASVAVLVIGGLFIYWVAAARRWKYSLIGSFVTAVIAAAVWFFVPHRDGSNLVQMHYNAGLRLSELRSLPPGQIDQFLTNREARNKLARFLPRFDRLIQAEEEQWLSQTLAAVNDQAASCLEKSDPLKAWDVLKGPLWNLPAPTENSTTSEPRQVGFHNEWLRAKGLRLKAAKTSILVKLNQEEFSAARKIAGQLASEKSQDRLRGTEVDQATEQFIESVEFLSALNDLSRSAADAPYQQQEDDE
jgi:hypothetical protein